MGGLQWQHWLIVIVVFVLLFGAKKLPTFARSLGKSMGEFKKAREDFEYEITRAEADGRTKAAQKPDGKSKDDLEAEIATKQRLALIGDTGGDRARHRADAADGGDAKRDTGKEDQEAGQAAAHLAQRKANRE